MGSIVSDVTVPGRERNIALLGIFLCIFLAALDQTIVATALPKIVQELGGTTLYAWVATSYLLASTVALPIAGRLADMVSPKYILLCAAGVFLLGSALSGLSQSMTALIAFRGLQGLGGGAIFAVAATVLGLLFPPRARGRVQGLFGAVFGLASVVGPYLGGVLTDHLSWRWVFYVNMPVGVLALYVLLVHMPNLRSPRRHAFDTAGVLTLVLWTVPLLLALSWAGSTYPWGSPVIVGLLLLSVAFLLLFYRLERHSSAPLFDMRLLSVPTFVWAGAGTLFFGAAFLGAILFLPFYLVFAKGVSPTASGLALTPLTIGTVIGSVSSGQLASRLGRVKPILLAANLWAAAMLFLLARALTVSLPMSQLITFMVLLGIGLGPGFPLYTLSVQNVVRREQMGVASSGNQFFRQIGSAIGAAVLGALLVATLARDIPANLPRSLRSSFQVGSLQTNATLSPAAIQASVTARFDRLARQVASALNGNTQALEALRRNPELPARIRRRIPAGGIPGIVRRRTAATLRLLSAALAGNPGARSQLLERATLPPSVQSLLIDPPSSPFRRAAVLQTVRQVLQSAEGPTSRRLEAAIIPPLEARIRQQGQRTARLLIRAVTLGITAAVRNVFSVATLLALLAFVAGCFLPGLELRRHHMPEFADEPAEAEPTAT